MKPKRNHKSIYFDKETRSVQKASLMPSYPAARKHRYIFLFYSFSVPDINNKRVKEILNRNGIKVKKNKTPFLI